MMGKPIYGNGFKGCISYIATGERGKNPDRVEWSSSRNMGGLDAERDHKLAARSMRATANTSSRCKTPVMHVPISWPKEDGKLDREQMEKVADQTLKDLGLEKHQAVIYCHNDTDHQHIHIVVNRIDSKTGRAWSTSKDWQRLNKSLAKQEKEMGLTKSDHWGVDKQRDKQRLIDRTRVDDFDDITAPTDGERKQAKKEDREPERLFTKAKVKEVRGKLRGHFVDAVSWEDLDGRLKAQGYSLRGKGQGLIVTDGRGYAKLSQMGTSKAKVQLKEMEGRFGQSYRDWTIQQQRDDLTTKLEPPELVGQTPPEKEGSLLSKSQTGNSRPDPVMELDDADWEFRHWQNVESEHRRATKNVDWHKKKAEYLNQRKERSWDYTVKRHDTFMDYMGRVYADPKAANRRWEKMEKEHGSTKAAELIAENPKALGDFAHIEKRKSPQRGRKRTIGQAIKGKIEEVLEARQRRETHQIARANKLMPYIAAKRKRWLHASLEVADLRQKRRKLLNEVDRAQHNLAMLEKSTGTKRSIKDNLAKQIKRRYQALNRVTTRMIRTSKLTEERKGQLDHALRMHKERKREKSRRKELGLDLRW